MGQTKAVVASGVDRYYSRLFAGFAGRIVRQFGRESKKDKHWLPRAKARQIEQKGAEDAKGQRDGPNVENAKKSKSGKFKTRSSNSANGGDD